jgi:hypothetical protein
MAVGGTIEFLMYHDMATAIALDMRSNDQLKFVPLLYPVFVRDKRVDLNLSNVL